MYTFSRICLAKTKYYSVDLFQEILLEVEKQKMVLDKRLLSNNNQLSEKEEEMQVRSMVIKSVL